MKPPVIAGVVETCLPVQSLERSVAFYRDLLGLAVLFQDHRMCALRVTEGQVLLLFLLGGSTEAHEIPGGTIPPHDARGVHHVGFAIDQSSLPSWEAKLAEAGVDIESRVSWPRGGVSLYFRDPDDHSVELLTPGVWEVY